MKTAEMDNAVALYVSYMLYMFIIIQIRSTVTLLVDCCFSRTTALLRRLRLLPVESLKVMRAQTTSPEPVRCAPTCSNSCGI